ncbi:MAG: glycosyltransferase [Granulosicoccus sp.]
MKPKPAHNTTPATVMPASQNLVADSVQASSPQPLRVLHFICSTGFYGAEKWVLALANNLDTAAVHSELAVTRESADHDLELTRQFRALSLPAHEIELAGRFDIISAVKKLAELIRERRIDIIHTHGYKSDILGILAARRSGVASVCTPHGFENADDWKLGLYIKLGCQTFRFFDRVAPLSLQLVEDVKRYGVKHDRITYIQNGVDLKPIEIERQKRQQERRAIASVPILDGNSDQQNEKSESTPKSIDEQSAERTIGFIGQLISRKNVGDILTIFDALAAQHPAIKLVLLGDGEERLALEEQAAGLASNDRIEFKGFVNDPLAWLRSFDLFVLTSTLEGIPRCVMESMAMGVAIAAYDIAGIDQLLEHDKTGLLCKFGDRETMQRLWESALFDAELAQRISDSAAVSVRERFSAAAMAERYTALYAELIVEKTA